MDQAALTRIATLEARVAALEARLAALETPEPPVVDWAPGATLVSVQSRSRQPRQPRQPRRPQPPPCESVNPDLKPPWEEQP